MRTYRNIDQFIENLSDSDKRLYDTYLHFNLRLEKSEYVAKIQAAESVINAINMSKDKSILRY
jgi:hypothetical protein